MQDKGFLQMSGQNGNLPTALMEFRVCCVAGAKGDHSRCMGLICTVQLTHHCSKQDTASSYCGPDNRWSSQHMPYCISGSCQLRLLGARMFGDVTDIQLTHPLIIGELQACSAHRQLLEMLHMCTATGLSPI